MVIGKFSNGQCAFRPDLPTIDRRQELISQTMQVFPCPVLITNRSQPPALLFASHLAVLKHIVAIPQKPAPVLFEEVSFLRHENCSLRYFSGIATCLRYSERLSPMAFTFARILAASAFVATNRNAIFRLWLAGTSGLPDRFAIPSYFPEINYLK
jgi:hypothetical protein